MSTIVRFVKGVQFCTEVKAGQVMCDEEGEDHPSAPDLLMAALGSCTGSVIVVFAERHQIPYEGMEIELDWKTAEDPYRIGHIQMSITMPGKLNAEQRNTLERVAHQCLIHNTLLHPPRIDMEITEAKGK